MSYDDDGAIRSRECFDRRADALLVSGGGVMNRKVRGGGAVSQVL
jgi:hypothetical protein